MRYCITLRSRPDGRITGWYDGSDKCWSTDRSRGPMSTPRSRPANGISERFK
jgi:hypothetical protein